MSKIIDMMYEFVGFPLHEDSFGQPAKRDKKLERLNKRICELRTENRRLRSDIEDMYFARQTIFYRCKCGHIRERGIVCVNEKCPVRYD